MASSVPAEKTCTNSVRILTLNCWGLMLVSRKRTERINSIARRLCESREYDIIALQEIWVESDYELLRKSVSSYLPYAKRWYSGILTGPGLAVFSRWPIESAWIYRFPLNGRPSAFWRGDWYVGKAAGCCVIIHPSGRRLEIINAHLHAPYAPSGDAAYECHRAAQAWDLSGIVKRSSRGGLTTFVTGDLNTRPESVGMKLLQYSHLRDAWTDSHDFKEYTIHEIAQMTPEEQITLAGVTSDSQLNSWRANYAIDRAKRLDYIFYDAETATPIESQVAFVEPEPSVGSVSDHFAFEAKFLLIEDPNLPLGLPTLSSTLDETNSSSNGMNTYSNNMPDQLDGNGIASAHFTSSNIPSLRNHHSPASKSDLGLVNTVKPVAISQLSAADDVNGLRELHHELLKIIEEYKPTCSFQALWRLSHFWLSVLFVVGLCIAVWWGAAKNRSYVGFIFIIAAVLAAVTGVLNGLMGFLFGRGEKRALREFEEQVALSLFNLDINY